MAEPYIGEIRLFPFDYAPRGWALCNGDLLLIAQNAALFALLGTTFGGNGQTTFGLPDLRGRVPMGYNMGGSLGSLGEKNGAESVVLNADQMPAHSHTAEGSSLLATIAGKSPVGNVWATINSGGATPYASVSSDSMVTMDSKAIGTTGGGAPHSNMQPYAVVNYCIAVQGLWPPRPESEKGEV